VRNFYNNILVPNSPNGHVTIDTHAVAAALLRPLSGSSREVLHNFGGDGAASNSAQGSSGTYGLYVEAYRRAAQERGVLTRQMQSITWEAVCGLFTAGFKSQQKTWTQPRRSGEITKKERLPLTTPENSSSTLQAELKALRGTDSILDLLLERGPVTRQSYLAYNFPDGVPDPMPGELEANLPRPLQNHAAPTRSRLPDAPTRQNFHSQDEFEEALGYWQGHVGRIKAMADRASRSKGSQPR